jgi:formylglycine-generating enzyme required for sulfatase activity
MVLIPGGTFWMGCVPGDSECGGDEKPRHQVTVDSFHMDTHEVTQAQYERVMGKNPSNFKNCSDCPVENVSWDDARSYCSKVGKRLPTEAEWEYAARGGKDGEVRHGSLGDVAWYDGNSEKKTHPVGKKAPNGFGLYDMLGNVWEWCSDWYDEGYYAKSPLKDPHGAESGANRVLRGGSWYYGPGIVRASNRGRNTPDDRNFNIGFRCVRDQ